MSSDLGSAAVLGPSVPRAKAGRLVTLRTWFVVLTSYLRLPITTRKV